MIARVALALVLVVGCGGSDDEDAAATRSRPCEQLRTHLIDLRLADATHVDLEAHRAAMTQALGDRFVASCTSTLTHAQIACALKAADSTTAAECSRSAATN